MNKRNSRGPKTEPRGTQDKFNFGSKDQRFKKEGPDPNKKCRHGKQSKTSKKTIKFRGLEMPFPRHRVTIFILIDNFYPFSLLI